MIGQHHGEMVSVLAESCLKTSNVNKIPNLCVSKCLIFWLYAHGRPLIVCDLRRHAFECPVSPWEALSSQLMLIYIESNASLISAESSLPIVIPVGYL